MPERTSARGSAIGVGSARDVLIATAVAGAAGYGITVAAGAVLGSDAYVPFAAFWSVVYFVVGALGGVQQEVTRASRPSAVGQSAAERGTLARSLFLATAGATVVLLGGTAPWWVARVFPTHGGELLWPTLAGAAGYLAVCVVSGVLAGLASWRWVAIITVTDAVLRAIAVAAVLATTRDVTALAWAVALPFGLVGALAAWWVSRRVAGRYVIADSLRTLAWNAARTVASGAAMGALITGLPAILAATTAAAHGDEVASIIYVSNLVRSPLIVLTMAFQGLLVQRLRDAERAATIVLRLLGAVTGVVAVATVPLMALGPWLLDVVGGGDYSLSRGAFGVLVASAAPTAAMFVTGAALLARSRHGAYLAGWAVAALIAVAGLASPLPLWTAVTVAVFAAPVAGLVIHLGAWLRRTAPSEA